VTVALYKAVERLVTHHNFAQGAGGVHHVPFAVIATRKDA